MPDTQAENPEVDENIVHSRPTNQKRNRILLGIGIRILACIIIGVVAIVFAQIYVRKEIGPIESVLDSYMKYMDAKDSKSTYALICLRAQKRTTLSEYQKVLDGKIYASCHEKFQSISVGIIEVRSTTAGTDPDAPQGIVANVSGNISYKDGKQAGFNAILEKIMGIGKYFSLTL